MPRITVTTPDGHKQRYELSLEMDVVTIGRDNTCEIVINDPTVSGYHAEIRRIKGGFCIVDCESTSGVQVNGMPTEWAELTNGMQVQLGGTTLNFLFTDPELNLLIEEKKADGHDPVAVMKASQEGQGHGTEPVPAAAIPVPPEAEQQIQAPEPVYQAPVYDSPVAGAAPAARPVVRRPVAAPVVGGGVPDRPYGPGAGRPGYQISHEKGGGGIYALAVALICVFALIAGMTLRHYQETGGILFNDLFTKAEEIPVEEPKPEPKPEEPKPKEELKPEPKPEPKPVEPPKVKPVEEKDIMDGAIKESGKDKLPSLDEFIIP